MMTALSVVFEYSGFPGIGQWAPAGAAFKACGNVG